MAVLGRAVGHLVEDVYEAVDDISDDRLSHMFVPCAPSVENVLQIHVLREAPSLPAKLTLL